MGWDGGRMLVWEAAQGRAGARRKDQWVEGNKQS